MAFPSPLYVLLKQRKYLTIAGALDMTFSDEFVYDSVNYRDTMDAGVLGNPHSFLSTATEAQTIGLPLADDFVLTNAGLSAHAIMTTHPIVTATSGGISAPNLQATSPSVATPQGSYAAYPDSKLNGAMSQALLTDSLFEQDDRKTHVAPRREFKIRTAMKFWDVEGAVEGMELTLGGLTTNGSHSIIHIPTRLIKVGQAISGTGIPADTVVAKILTDDSLEISHPATATGGTAITLAAGTVSHINLLGMCWADEFIGFATAAPTTL